MINKIVNYFKNAYQEMRKVVWPSRQEVISHTVIVVIAIAVSLGVLALVDFGLFNLLQILIYRK